MNDGRNGGAVAPFAIAVEAGVLLGAGYMVTCRLWLPIALHAGWSVTQTGRLGLAGAGRRVLATQLHGPALLTGGGNPEASLVALACPRRGGVACEPRTA